MVWRRIEYIVVSKWHKMQFLTYCTHIAYFYNDELQVWANEEIKKGFVCFHTNSYSDK